MFPQGPTIPGDVKFSNGEFTNNLNVIGSNLSSSSTLTKVPTLYVGPPSPPLSIPLTVSDIFNGIISVVGEIILQFPTASVFVSSVNQPYVGQTFDLLVSNTGVDTVWFVENTGVTVNNASYKTDTGSYANIPLKIRITNVVTPSYTVY